MASRPYLAAIALAAAAGVGAVIAIGSGCTVLTNDALPDDAGIFQEASADAAKAATCATCLTAACTAAQSLCLTSASCLGIVECAGASTCDTTCKTACACDAPTTDAGANAERLHHAYTACNDARLATCAKDCAAEAREAGTLPPCTEPLDAGAPDAESDAAPDADAAAPGPDACRTCAASFCGPALAACASGTECARFLACSSVCRTTSCADDCARLHATGKVTATELATCTAASCQTDCEL